MDSHFFIMKILQLEQELKNDFFSLQRFLIC